MQELDELVRTNVHLVIDLLDDVSLTLPKKFPTKESLDKFDLAGVWNKYNKVKKPIEPKSQEVLNFITNYLKIEEITK